MRQKPLPAGYFFSGLLYYGLMVYWQWDELQTTGKAQNSAIIGLVMSSLTYSTYFGVSELICLRVSRIYQLSVSLGK